jgi:hypothetical protein
MKKLKTISLSACKKLHAINLIKDDLKNTRLVAGLEELGLDSGKYYLNLSETIFFLMGFEIGDLNEKMFEDYSDRLSTATELNIVYDYQKLDHLALEIYKSLLKEKEKICAQGRKK